MTVISYIGRYDGRNWLPFWVDIGVVAVFSLAIFALAVAVRLDSEVARGYIEDLDPMVTEPELDLAESEREPLRAGQREPARAGQREPAPTREHAPH